MKLKIQQRFKNFMKKKFSSHTLSIKLNILNLKMLDIDIKKHMLHNFNNLWLILSFLCNNLVKEDKIWWWIKINSHNLEVEVHFNKEDLCHQCHNHLINNNNNNLVICHKIKCKDNKHYNIKINQILIKINNQDNNMDNKNSNINK